MSKPTQIIVPDFSETDTLNMKQRVHAARVLADEIDNLICDLPIAGANYGESVGEKAEAIMHSVLTVHRITDGQMKALENMKTGLEKWFNN